MDRRTEIVLNKARDKINSLILAKKTGKIDLTIELNMTQGAIGSAYLENYSKENISFDEVKK